MYSRLFVPLFVLLLFAACGDTGNSEPEMPGETTGAETPPLPNEREGIYATYTNTNRDIWQKPELVLDLLGDLSNKTVADIGAGTGFFAFRLAPRAEKVIAIDINPAFVNYLDSVKVLELPAQQQNRLEARLAVPEDPRLAANEVDVIMIVNTLPYIENQVDYLRNLRTALRPRGRLLIVDFKRKRLPANIGPPPEDRLPLHVVEEMLEEAGYTKYTSIDTALDYQYIVMVEI